MPELHNKYKGCLIGLAIGDTLGMSLEFKSVGEFEPVTEPREGGPFNLPLGYWTDDTSMALCLGDSLLEKQGYDSFDVMEKYLAWRLEGYRSSTGTCFDIGNQVSTALNDYMRDGGAVVPSGKGRLSSAGNGSIMRLAPVVIAAHAAGNTLEATMEIARISARETHYSLEAEAGTALFGALLYNALESKPKDSIFKYGDYEQNEQFIKLAEIILAAPRHNASTINPSGYIVDSLVAAVWSFMTHDTFEAGALAAVNLGGDADTIGAIYGQLAGAYYGYDHIPKEWKNVLYQEQEIALLSNELADMKQCPILVTRFDEDGDKYTQDYKIETTQGDITALKMDAIVNAANTKLFGGSGVCGAIFNAAGYDEMTAACQKIDHCEYGDAVVTPGFKLSAKYVIHSVGPIYGQHSGAEPDILQSCYWESLRKAQDLRLKSVAFPLISTGIYGYPKDEAARIAIRSVREFFEDNPHTSLQQVTLVAYTSDDLQLINSNV